jgi:hypothetical protein
MITSYKENKKNYKTPFSTYLMLDDEIKEKKLIP